MFESNINEDDKTNNETDWVHKACREIKVKSNIKMSAFAMCLAAAHLIMCLFNPKYCRKSFASFKIAFLNFVSSFLNEKK